MQELANMLGREYVQLEFLLFKSLELQHLLQSEDNRFLRWAGEEILRASRQVMMADLERQRRVRELAPAHGLAGVTDPSLAVLAEHVPQPWRTIFEEHVVGIRQLVCEVDSVITATTALAEARGHSVAAVLKEMHRPLIASPREGRHPTRISMALP